MMTGIPEMQWLPADSLVSPQNVSGLFWVEATVYASQSASPSSATKYLFKTLNPTVHLWFIILRTKDSLCALVHGFCVGRKGRTEGGGLGSPAG